MQGEEASKAAHVGRTKPGAAPALRGEKALSRKSEANAPRIPQLSNNKPPLCHPPTAPPALSTTPPPREKTHHTVLIYIYIKKEMRITHRY